MAIRSFTDWVFGELDLEPLSVDIAELRARQTTGVTAAKEGVHLGHIR
jgi:hypothetical protein